METPIFYFSNLLALNISQFPVDLQLQPVTILLSMISGIAVGFSLGLIGGGGSILAVPLLIYVVGVADPHAAIGTSAVSVAANALTNMIHHNKRGHVRVKEGLAFALPGVVGALIGAQLGLLTPANNLLLLFAVFMAVISVRMLRSKLGVSTMDVASRSHNIILLHKKRLTLTGFLVGIAAGYFGIGGGFLIVPTLMYSAGLNIIDAIGTSLLSVSAFGLTTAIRYSLDSQISWAIASLFIAGGIGGGMVGTKLSSKAPKRTLSKIFAVLLLVVATYIILSTIVV